MRHLKTCLLSLGLLSPGLLTTSSAAPRPGDTSSAEAPARLDDLVVLHHDGDTALRDRLRSAGEVWLDAGTFLVARTRPAVRTWLEGRGVQVSDLPAVGANEELYLVGLTSADAPRRLAELGGRLLYREGQQGIVALDGEHAGELHELEPGRFFHCGVVPFRRRAMRPLRAFSAPGGTLGLGAGDPRVQAIVDQVDESNIEATVVSLSSISSRRATEAGATTAQQQLVADFAARGYTTTLQDFGAQYSRNVVAEIPGQVDPNKVVVIGAHYDSINHQLGPGSIAPGADDNASGSGGVLEAARIFAGAGPFKYTLRFILFSGEELGLLGAQHASGVSLASGEEVIAMLNMDMISYRANGDVRDVDFATNSTSSSLTSFCQQLGQTYVPGWATTSGVLTAGSSDHAAYNADGWPAAFFFEDLTQYFAQIHTVQDDYPASTTDFLLAKMAVQGVVASAATLAEPLDLTIDHTPLSDTQALGPYTVSAQVSSAAGSVTGADLWWRVDGGAWTTVPMVFMGDHWEASIPGQGSPVDFEYYLEATDDQGFQEALPSQAQGPASFGFFVGVRNELYANDFEGASDEGWTHGQVATQDDWQRGTPAGNAGDPVGAFSGQSAWANDLGQTGWNGEYQPNVENWLRSPQIDLAGETAVELEFRRWLTVEDGFFDQAQIYVNGSLAWQNVTSPPPSGGAEHTIDNAWTLQRLDVSSFVTAGSPIQVEFRLTSDGGLQFGGWTLDDFKVVSRGPVPCPAPQSYCTASPNSAGGGALISSSGSTSVAANDLVLRVDGAVAGQPGLYYYGPNAISAPFGDGMRCVGGGTHRLAPVQVADGSGVALRPVDLTAPPADAGPGQVQAGSTWNFQFWYRDPAAAGSGFNLSDGLSVTFCP